MNREEIYRQFEELDKRASLGGGVDKIEKQHVLNWPVNMTYLAAQWLVERDSAGKELDDEELLRNTDRRSLYGWYLDQTYGGAYVSGARFSALGPEPVSYTHLDVYKRQVRHQFF